MKIHYNFPLAYQEVQARIKAIKPEKYAKTRNYLNGAVSYLSPYISRGFISTKIVYEHIQSLGLPFYKTEKFVQELAWRDYWQVQWLNKGEQINEDLRRNQESVLSRHPSQALVEGQTGVTALDAGVDLLKETGYMHNHLRMYTASVACNIAGNHWREAAHWMYYYLLDADWASNALSWQWVAGTNSNKKYYANQQNINKYCKTSDRGTFLDFSYEELPQRSCPRELLDAVPLNLQTVLPEVNAPLSLKEESPVLIYNFYNVDPLWKKGEDCNRILLLEPEVFDAYPVSQKSIEFCMSLAKENIEGIQIYVGSFNDLQAQLTNQVIYYKEHPLNTHYQGEEESRDWMFDVQGEFRSFFAFWKKCKKQL